MTNIIGKYVIVRGDRSGVFAGILAEKNGREITLNDCRRLWYWSGANSISQIAVDGVKKPQLCRFTVTVDEIIILDALEIIPCTTIAEDNIRAVLEWRA